MKDVQCYELFGGIALKNHAFSSLQAANVPTVLSYQLIYLNVFLTSLHLRIFSIRELPFQDGMRACFIGQ